MTTHPVLSADLPATYTACTAFADFYRDSDDLAAALRVALLTADVDVYVAPAPPSDRVRVTFVVATVDGWYEIDHRYNRFILVGFTAPEMRRLTTTPLILDADTVDYLIDRTA
jgi:hypothetical protein